MMWTGSTGQKVSFTEGFKIARRKVADVGKQLLARGITDSGYISI